MSKTGRTSFEKVGRVVAAAALAVSFGACSGDKVVDTCPAGMTGSPPNCQPIRDPCTQDTLVQDSGPIPARTILYDDFSVPDDGRLDVTLDWTNAASRMGFYLVPVGTCTLDEFNARSCDFFIRNEPDSQKPRRLSQEMAAGNYRWMIGNFEEEQESASLQIVLSQGDCPTSGRTPGASDRGATSTPALELIQSR